VFTRDYGANECKQNDLTLPESLNRDIPTNRTQVPHDDQRIQPIPTRYYLLRAHSIDANAIAISRDEFDVAKTDRLDLSTTPADALPNS
jgi:hypothetical protein